VANFTVAVTPRVKDADGWRDGETSFFRCAACRTLAEHVAELAKGDRVIVYGTLRQRSWQTEDGERRSAVEVQAEEDPDADPILPDPAGDPDPSRPGQPVGPAPAARHLDRLMPYQLATARTQERCERRASRRRCPVCREDP
jgi:single-stranded DNA-binding protein